MEKRLTQFLIKKRIVLSSILFLCVSSILFYKNSSAQSQQFYEIKPVVTEKLFARGEALYQKQCSVCHGPQGMADGRAAYLLYPKPRNFAQDQFRLVSTTNMEATDDDIFKTVTRGMPGSSMPSWGHLKELDRWALVYYVRYLVEAERFKESGELTAQMIEKGLSWEITEKMVKKEIDPQNIIKISQEPEITQEALKRGQELFAASCAGCHGAQGRGDGQQKMTDNLGYSLKPRDLTAGIFKGESSSEELYFRMIGGMPGTPMPSYLDALTREQIWDLIHFVQTLAKSGAEERARLKYLKIRAKKISEDVDLNPFADYWAEANSTFVSLTPLWWHDDRVEGVDIKALHNGKKIAFYLTWDDLTKDENIVAVQSFSDGAALQFSKRDDPPFFGMGNAQDPVHIWHWKAGWEKVGEKREDIETQYPHAAIDWYESQTHYQRGSPFEVTKSKTQFHDPKFTTGWGVGNPISNPRKEETAEEAMAEGLGSYTTQMPKIEKVEAKGVWLDGKWHVVFLRALKSSEKEGLTLMAGNPSSIAFAIWDGAQKDRNGQKSVSIWNQLILE